MPQSPEYRHPLNMRGSQQSLPALASRQVPAMQEDFDKKIREHKEHMQRLEAERESIERANRELEQINASKKQFIHQNGELCEKLSNALTLMSRHLVESRNQLAALEDYQSSFTACLNKINNINPDHWPTEELKARLEKALTLLEAVQDEYDSAANYFENSTHAEIFGITAATKKTQLDSTSGFWMQVRAGFAHHLALIIFLILAVAVLWLK